MSFEAMLNHRCDIYHIRREDESPGYGLPSSPAFYYASEPDIEDLECHFSSRGSRSVVQGQPEAIYSAGIKLVVPLETDIRLNDKVVNKSDGYEYTAEIPVRIRDHHKYVMLTRKSRQEAL